MASQSPPKPWERASTAALSSTSGTLPSQNNPHISTANQSSSAPTSQPPPLPSKPSALSSVVDRTASKYSPYGGASRLGGSPYGGGMGGYNSYSSPYSRFGGMNSSMYGGYGSMYGGMGGMGGMYGGMPGYGGGQPGMVGDPNSLTNSFSQSTQATFQIIESIVGAFGGFAQMLESTYMATHSSFFAMVSVAEQFSSLRDTLGSVLGIYTLLRYIRTLIAKISGRPPPADATSLTPSAFAAFQNRSVRPDGSLGPPRPSKKPFLVFIVAAFGLPYLMGKLIRALARSQEEEAAKRQQEQGILLGPDGRPLPPNQQQLDPSKLPFCRALYDYTPEAGNQATSGIDLSVKKGEIVAILSKSDPLGNPSEWWRCRTRDKREGYLPGIYLETIQRRPKEIMAAESGEGSRAHTMSSEGGTSRADSLQDQRPQTLPKQLVKAKVGDITAESFQKSQFYS